MNLDWTYHLYSLVPHILRRPKRMVWLSLMLTGLKRIHDAFLLWRTDVNQRASFTGQKMVLERMLNMRYFGQDVWSSDVDPTASGHIWIDRTSNVSVAVSVWYEQEQQPNTLVIYYESEGGAPPDPIYYQGEANAAYSFKVMLPQVFYDQYITTEGRETELRALLSRYLETGYDYIIEPY